MLHNKGIIIRDFTPNNILIDDAGDVAIIDLENAQFRDSLYSFFHDFTPGYASIRHRNGDEPSGADDLYSLGCILFYMVVGRDPYFGDFIESPFLRMELLIKLIRPELVGVWGPIIALCLECNSENVSAHLGAIEKLLEQSFFEPKQPVAWVKRADMQERYVFCHAAMNIGDELVRSMVRIGENGGMWRSSTSISSQSLATNINSGISGIGLLLIELYLHAERLEYLQAAERAAVWAYDDIVNRKCFVPNPYFGDLGLVYLLLRLNSVSSDGACLEKANALLSKVEKISTMPDLMHGAAGQGMVNIAMYLQSNNEDYLQNAILIGDALCKAAKYTKTEVLWHFPQDAAAGFGGQAYYGFAHGSAGIGQFFIDLYRVTQMQEYLDIACQVAKSLACKSESNLSDGSGLNWPKGSEDPTMLPYWCNGAPGIGVFFLNLYHLTNDEKFLKVAQGAARTAEVIAPFMSMGLCHGMAGNAQLLLDLYAGTGDSYYYDQAVHIGRIARASSIGRVQDRLLSTAHSHIELVPDYMVGYSGVAEFYLRLANPNLPQLLSYEYWARRFPEN